MIDLSLLNSWNCYRRDADNLKIQRKDILRFAEFRWKVAHALIRSGKALQQAKRGHPCQSPGVLKRKHFSTMPQNSVRLDRIDHFPSIDSIRRTCKNDGCAVKTNVVCKKCGINLCLNNKANCFAKFHLA